MRHILGFDYDIRNLFKLQFQSSIGILSHLAVAA